MRVWQKNHSDTHCGLCNRYVARGESVLLIMSPKWREKMRCRECAGEPLPVDVPDLAECPDVLQPRLKQISEFAAVSSLAADYRTKRSGEQ